MVKEKKSVQLKMVIVPAIKGQMDKQFHSLVDSVEKITGYQIDLIDMNDRIWCNGEIWENRNPRPLTPKQTEIFRTNCRYISDNINNLRKDRGRYEECISFFQSIVNDYKKFLATIETEGE